MIVVKQSVFTGLPQSSTSSTSSFRVGNGNTQTVAQATSAQSAINSSINTYGKSADLDLTHVFQALQGNLRFGNPNVNFSDGENISGQFVTFTTTTANTEVNVPHTLGVIPIGYIVTGINVGGVIYSSGTAWTMYSVYIKCSAANATANMFLLI